MIIVIVVKGAIKISYSQNTKAPIRQATNRGYNNLIYDCRSIWFMIVDVVITSSINNR